MKKIYLASPHMSSQGYEENFVKETFESNWIAPLGKNVDEFENEISERVNVKHAAALSSGTGALHLALKYLDIHENDIVFCQSLTFSASANPIIYQNATPVFIDSDYKTWNMCPLTLKQALEKYNNIGKLPKAVIVVHLYGFSADMDPIIDLCKQYNITLIEDAAESLGTLYKGNPTGSFGKFAIMSFNGNKIITTSGGGMLVSDDEEAIKKARFWATQSRDQARHYQHSELGFNYRLSNVLAAIGRGQLMVLDERIAKKKYIFEYYKRELADIPEIQFMPVNDWNEPNYWLTCILVNSPNNQNIQKNNLKFKMQNVKTEDNSTFNIHNSKLEITPLDIMLALEAENIESRPIWKPMHLQPFFEKYDFIGYEVSETIFNYGLCLPSDTKMTDDDLFRICSIIKNLF